MAPATNTTGPTPAAVITASTSSAQPSKVGRSFNDTGSGPPGPGGPYDTTPANDNSRSVTERIPDGSAASRFENHDGIITISCGPSPRTRNASRAFPLIA